MTEEWFLGVMARSVGGVQWLMAAHLLAVGGAAYLLSGVVRLMFMWRTSALARERMGAAMWFTVPAIIGLVWGLVGLLYRVSAAYELGTPNACAFAVVVVGEVRPYCSLSVGGLFDYGGQGLVGLAVGGLMHSSAAKWRATERAMLAAFAAGHRRRATDLKVLPGRLGAHD